MFQRVKFELAKAGGTVWAPWEKPATAFIAFSDGFHGRTMGALSLTWKAPDHHFPCCVILQCSQEAYRNPFEPLMPHVDFATFGDIESVRKLAKKGYTAAVFVEPVQGEGGIRQASPEFFSSLRALCDDIGALLVFDEVQCGLGRTGLLWAHEAVGVTPDILTAAKPLAGGLPIGASFSLDSVCQGSR